jgi:hypothetical protein
MSREKFKLILHRQSLAAGDHRIRRVRALAGGERAEQHRAQDPGPLPVLLRHQAGDMALGDVAELVCKNRRELVLGGGDVDQPQLQAKPGARQRERIDDAVLAQQYPPGETLVDFRSDFAARAGGREQPRPDVQDVFIQHRVVEIVGIAIQVACDLLTQLALGAAGHLAGVTQGGELRPRGHRRQRADQTHCSQGTQRHPGTHRTGPVVPLGHGRMMLQEYEGGVNRSYAASQAT